VGRSSHKSKKKGRGERKYDQLKDDPSKEGGENGNPNPKANVEKGGKESPALLCTPFSIKKEV